MARIFIGYEVADRDTAAVVMATFPKTAKAGPPRIIRLRDRTGPSLRERVAELEAAEKDAAGRAGASLREIGDRVIAMCDSRLVDMGKRLAALESALGEPVCVGCGGSIGHHHAPDQGGCSGWFPTVREHLARVETEHRAAVERIGDLEREPSVAEERESDDDAPVRPEESVAANPGWLAKVTPEPTDTGLARMVRSMTEALKSDAEIGRAIYDFGREHGSQDRAALLARAEKAERELEALKARRTAEQERADVMAWLSDRAGSIDCRRAEKFEECVLVMTDIENGAHVGAAARSATRPTTPEPTVHVPTESSGADGARLAPSEAEMAAELRRERWTTLWVAPTLRIYSAWMPAPPGGER